MTAPSVRPRARRWPIALAILVIPFVLFSLYVGLMLRWSYSDGDRAGVLQKFSRRGWLCKTYEGELAMTTAPGTAPTIWDFSAREGAIISKLRASIGKRVVVHYTEHRGVPTSCFGQTGYFADSISLQQ
jgi:hypothetical protein